MEPDTLVSISSLSLSSNYEKRAVAKAFDLWMSEISGAVCMEKLRMCGEVKVDVFDKIWDGNTLKGQDS